VNLEQTEELAVRWTKAQPMVAAFIASLVPDFHQAEDVLHQVAVILVRKFAEYDRTQPFEAWAIGMARLEVLKHRRQFAQEKHVFDEALVTLVSEEFVAFREEFDGRRQALAECLKQLKGRFLQVLQLRYFEGLEPTAIGERWSMPTGAVRAVLHRARQALRRCIERRFSPQEGRG
jgi:RNA polymerase sigma-70 factor (ECF subfamily)